MTPALLVILLMACDSIDDHDTNRPVTETGDPSSQALYIPPLYAAVDHSLELYFDTVLTADGDPVEGAPAVVGDFEWRVTTDAHGTLDANRWTWTPTETTTIDLHLDQSLQGGVVEQVSTTIEVVPAHSGDGLTIAVIGDSLTYMGFWVDDLAASLPGATFVGTLDETPMGWWTDGWSGASAYSWTTNEDSPLVTDGRLDAATYMNNLGAMPDVVIIMLGINRVVTAEDHLWEDYVEQELEATDAMMSALMTHGVEVCIPVLTTPGHDDQASWTDNYAGESWEDQFRWELRHRHQLRRQVERWSGRENEGVFVAAAATAIDPADGYPDDNALHPQAGNPGYQQLAAPLHAAVSRSQWP